jgi:hypothetical protein
MEKAAIKDLIYGGINELMQDRRYYYRSSVGRDYSHWTDEGKRAMENFMREMTQYIWDAEEAALDKRAKDMVLEELKR